MLHLIPFAIFLERLQQFLVLLNLSLMLKADLKLPLLAFTELSLKYFLAVTRQLLQLNNFFAALGYFMQLVLN